MKVSLPWPCTKLSPNFRGHWAPIAKAKKAYRAECACELHHQSTAFERARIGAHEQVSVKLEFYPPNNRERDCDNLVASCKALIDGMADALNVNDSRFILAAPVLHKKDGIARVVVTLEGLT